jgi:hypothetical protein
MPQVRLNNESITSKLSFLGEWSGRNYGFQGYGNETSPRVYAGLFHATTDFHSGLRTFVQTQIVALNF